MFPGPAVTCYDPDILVANQKCICPENTRNHWVLNVKIDNRGDAGCVYDGATFIGRSTGPITCLNANMISTIFLIAVSANRSAWVAVRGNWNE